MMSIGNGSFATHYGSSGNDSIIGDAGNNHILGGAGDDFLYGVGGNNTLDGGAGNDFMSSGSGQDTFVFRFGDGQDVIQDFNLAQDRIALDGVAVSDLTLNSFAGGSQLIAADGTEFWFIGLTGVAESDLAFVDMAGNALAVDDPLIVINGTSGDDELIGNAAENNHILGGAGDDFLFGVAGNNILDGGAGNDFMSSGTGQDTFVFRLGDGQNVIQDFDITQDRIALDGLVEDDLDFIDYGSGSLLVADDGTEFWFIGLTGATRSDLAFV
jgi:Ca2+-binding RTX toxin-like protein